MNTQTSHPTITGAPFRTRLAACPPLHAGVISLAATIVLLGASGCSTQYRFAVDAVSQSPATLPRQSYRLVDARPAAEVDDPAFTRVAADVHTALSAKGLYEAPAELAPDLVVEVDFGISAPIERVSTRSEPIAAVMPPGWSSGLNRNAVAGTPGGTLQYIGNREVPYTETTYQKFLRLTAHEIAPDSRGALGRQVWSLHVVNEDDSKNLARYARLMVAAAMDYIDEDHTESRTVVLTRKDQRVTFVERGLESS